MERRTSILCGMGLIAICTWLTVRTTAAPPDSQGIVWFDDLNAAHKISLKQNKPMLVVFSADWCGYCRKLRKTTLSDPKLAGYVNAAFVPVYLDFDRQKKVAKILGVRSIPCSIILSPQADLLGRQVGYVSVKKYRLVLDDARRLHAKLIQANNSSEQPPDSP